MALQHYNSNDLYIRTAIAACAIGCQAAILAKKWRQGSITFCEQKQLEIATSQLSIIRCGFSVLILPSTTTITVTADGATSVASYITIDGVTVSDMFLYDIDNETTAIAIANAINNFTLLPDYTAVVSGDVVTVTAVTSGATINGATVAVVGGDVVAATEFMNGGQDGVLPEENNLTETQVEFMFNNIATFTGCCYAPLGYGYEDAEDTTALGTPLLLNTGIPLALNTGDPLRLNTPLLTP